MRLLVIDDDPLLLKSLRDILESDGHQVTTANGGREGIEAFSAALARNEEFGAVLSDLGMPHMDGRQVARVIKSLSSTTPIILLTGWGQRLLDDGELPQHIDQVLSKPPKLRTLREALGRCMR
jgi:CheY-like chemotaxis protein